MLICSSSHLQESFDQKLSQHKYQIQYQYQGIIQ